ncbi:hypothetical protein QBC39DRAFT_340052 [Podospora conica]|nr:hypothetical protein QBC39DRAFT_340052 [Schizothecium conicum]
MSVLRTWLFSSELRSSKRVARLSRFRFGCPRGFRTLASHPRIGRQGAKTLKPHRENTRHEKSRLGSDIRQRATRASPCLAEKKLQKKTALFFRGYGPRSRPFPFLFFILFPRCRSATGVTIEVMSWTATAAAAQEIQRRGGMKPCFDRLPGLQVSLIAGCNVKPGTTVEFRLTDSAWHALRQAPLRSCMCGGRRREAPAPVCVQPFGIPDNWIALKPPAVRRRRRRRWWWGGVALNA